MWEDNNPLSYDRRSSISSADYGYGSSPPASHAAPYASSHHQYSDTMSGHIADHDDEDARSIEHALGVDEGQFHDTHRNGHEDNRDDEDDDDDDDDDDDYPAARRGGYSSRVEQILAENKDLGITITDAGKNPEGSGGGYIVYTIRTGDLEVRRRYSEFESLRNNLALLYPCLIVPPIPEKHTFSDYATAPRLAKEDVTMIDLRKRMLGVFLNRCLRMKEIRRGTVFAKFLDPNASWSEVLHSPPISNLPKSHLRAPPSDPSNPTPAHAYLPIPSASARLRALPASLPEGMANPYAHRFPPPDQNLTESQLDPYFSNYEQSTKEYENLLTGSIEKVNRRILKRLTELSTDYNELGARYNAFSLSESGTLATAIERIGQAVDSSYIATEELARVLSSNFAEPLRESAQFAGVVRSVLKYRVMKRLQEEMTKDQLAQKKQILEELERSEAEARKIEQFLAGEVSHRRNIAEDRDDVESIDSADFPPTHGESPPKSGPISHSSPKRSQSTKSPTGYQSGGGGGTPSGSRSPNNHRKTVSVGGPSFSPSTPSSPNSTSNLASSIVGGVGNGISQKIFGRLSYAVHGIVDVDPETTRRNNIGKTRERLAQLEQGLGAAQKDVQEASSGVLKDLKRFQREKEEDLKRMMVTYAKTHIEWAKKNLETWEEARAEVEKIQAR
ncbi:hypothetical protein DFH27DRAFT_225032 [Peziza echinospora]|nr:hypothetical protein DFH27DRAFT_225032 [Peziza echinospora]